MVLILDFGCLKSLILLQKAKFLQLSLFAFSSAFLQLLAHLL